MTQSNALFFRRSEVPFEFQLKSSRIKKFVEERSTETEKKSVLLSAEEDRTQGA